MKNEPILDLSECTDLRRTLAARPPRVIRGTLVVLVGLLASGVLWAATSKADLVVKAPVRVRPVT